ncbi:MAG: transposase [Candidatus Desulforudaceae bacterium]
MRKRYPSSFKAQIVLEILKEEKTISQLASEHGIHPTQLHRWKAQAIENMPYSFSDGAKNLESLKASYEKQTEDLYAEIGRLTTKLSWLKRCPS